MPTRDIIVIGGSTGAIDALTEICAKLPPDLPAAVFVVVHVGSYPSDALTQILARTCPLRVIAAVDGATIEHGTVYIAPADRHLILVGETIRLGLGPRENMTRPAVDPLFRSAAASFGPRVIGVVLTGMLNDGSSGLGAVKQCGGITVVQNPADARADEMPLNALRCIDVDYRAPAADLGALLAELSRQQAGEPVPVPPDIPLEVQIALGRVMDTGSIAKIGNPVAITCPACGGVLTEIRAKPPLRYRCQTGHAYTAEVLDQEQARPTGEAIMVALRIIQERVTLTDRMIEDARAAGRNHSASILELRLEELRKHTEILRHAAIDSQQ